MRQQCTARRHVKFHIHKPIGISYPNSALFAGSLLFRCMIQQINAYSPHSSLSFLGITNAVEALAGYIEDIRQAFLRR